MTQKILLADDSMTIRKVVELTFSDEDFSIISVGDGAQALARARADRPDIILSDVMMPGLNGYELCQQIKAEPGLRGLPFLLLKGTFESFDEEKARACGADGFIAKPFESQELIRRVKELIAGAGVSAARAEAIPVPSAPRVIVPPPRPAPPPPAAPPAVPPAVRPMPQPAAPVRPAPTPPPVPPPAAPLRPAPTPVTVHPPAISQPIPGPARPSFPQAPPRAAAPPVPPRAPAPIRPEPVFSPPPVRHAPIPPPPPTPPTPTGPPPIPVPAHEEDYGFAFGEFETGHPVAPPAPAGRAAIFSAPSTPQEAEEDLWSEVSLRDQAPALGEKVAAEEESWGEEAGEEIFQEEPAAPAPGEEIFEEVSPARPAPVPSPPPAVHAATPAAAAPALEKDDLERIGSARLEAVVRQVLDPVVQELARKMIEEVAWEVIPELAEAMIRAEIERIRQSTRTG